MQYILKHKNVDVAEINLDEKISYILEITNVFAFEHLPMGTTHKDVADHKLLNSWWKSRAIPASRQGIGEVLDRLNILTPQELLDKSLGLSLSDQYWIAPKDKNIQWGNVNFFHNEFSEDIGNLLFGNESKSVQVDLMSPDNTSDGWLKKKWKIINGKRCLIKGGSYPFMQEPFNEVLASRLCDKLNIPHVSYSMIFEQDIPYCVCEDFINENTELIPAYYVITSSSKANHISEYQHYLDCCNEQGFTNITQAIDQMIVLDYIIANEDRHWNNFGIIRDANTLEWLKVAPIYDSGSSMGYNKSNAKLLSIKGVECKPFKKTHEEQIKLVKSFDWLDLKPTYNVVDEYNDLLKQSQDIDDTRRSALCQLLERRLNMLQNVIDRTKEKRFAFEQKPNKGKTR